ncbi:hypothetical protein ACCC98_29725, partial [Rhizobium pisi]|uniref:hypothetical protein n=1 Tax=Rhizobium pisi TaxID=574561 RepID=UPI0039B109C4
PVLHPRKADHRSGDGCQCGGRTPVTLLDAMFKELTEARYEYSKVEHGKELSEWIFANDDAWFVELQAHIANLLKP